MSTIKKVKLKLKIPIPAQANVFAETGDIARDLLLYEVDQLEVLEEIRLTSKSPKFSAKDGQFVNKGDVIFSEGLLGHKVMISDFNGILEIKDGKCRILGQKVHLERRISIDGKITRVVPNRYIEIMSKLIRINTCFYSNTKVQLTNVIYLESKQEINEQGLKFADFNTTVFVNDNIYVDDIAKLIALGVRRLVVNGVFINDIQGFKKEVDKLDGFSIIAGFGEFIAQKIKVSDTSRNILWGKHTIYFGSPIEVIATRTFEHPYWGITGEFFKKNELIGELDYNHEVFEFYLKNLEKNA
jgi:hypothetical protein